MPGPRAFFGQLSVLINAQQGYPTHLHYHDNYIVHMYIQCTVRAVNDILHTCHIFYQLYTGADSTIRNNEKQTPFDLSAKNPEVGRLLMVHNGKRVT